MSSRFVAGAAALALGSFAPHLAGAQSLPDIPDSVLQSEHITRSVEGTIRDAKRGRPGEEDSAIDGEAGLYVLTLNEIFYISGSAGLGFTDNPRRTADNRDGSLFGDAAISAGLATRLGERMDFGLSASINGREYFADRTASSRSASSSISLGLPVAGPLYLGVVGFGGASFNRDFDNSTAFYGTSASLSALLPLSKRLVVRPSVGGTRQWSGVSENNSVSTGGSLEVFYLASPKVSASARIGVSKRWYDDFYEDVTFVSRRDTQYTGSVAITWRPSKRAGITASVGYDRQDSTFFLSRYRAWETAATLTATMRF